jgi:hypothetical protein
LVIRGTQKLLDRARTPVSGSEPSTTALGDWYATVLPWRPQAVLFVNEPTRLPVLVRLRRQGVSSTASSRNSGQCSSSSAWILGFIEAELAEMTEHQWAKTTNRSVVGTMTEFGFLARHYRATDQTDDLLALTLWLARTPCGPLRRSERFPDRELRKLVSQMPGLG